MSEVGEVPVGGIEILESALERTKVGIDTCKEISSIIQKKTGVVSTVPKILVREGGIPVGLGGASVRENGQGGREGLILLPDGFQSKREGIETVAHEETHVILDSSLQGIGDETIRYPVAEGICDLVALEIADELTGERKRLQIIEARAVEYQDFKGKQEEVGRYFAEPLKSLPLEGMPGSDVPEGVGHIIGRRFAYHLRSANPGLDIKDFISCLLSNPPTTKEELLNPSQYTPKLKRYGAEPNEIHQWI